MELQCKDRVDLLEALRESRTDAQNASSTDLSTQARASSSTTTLPLQDSAEQQQRNPSWLGGGTVPPVDYHSIARPTSAAPPAPPPRSLPKRPSYISQKSATRDVPQTITSPPPSNAFLSPNPASTLAPTAANAKRTDTRTPSPEKKSGMLRTLRPAGKERTGSTQMARSLRSKPPAAAKAATQAWGPPIQHKPSVGSLEGASGDHSGPTSSSQSWDPYSRSLSDRPPSRDAPLLSPRTSNTPPLPPSHFDSTSSDAAFSSRHLHPLHSPSNPDLAARSPPITSQPFGESLGRNSPSSRSIDLSSDRNISAPSDASCQRATRRPQPPAALKPEVSLPSYRKEYPQPPAAKYKKPPNATPPRNWDNHARSDAVEATTRPVSPPKRTAKPGASAGIPRKAVGVVTATMQRQQLDDEPQSLSHSTEEASSSGHDAEPRRRARKTKPQAPPTVKAKGLPSPDETDSDPAAPSPTTSADDAWKKRVAYLLKHLPKGVDETAAKQIFNEIVIQGDEVHWDDVAGLDIAKSALKETVVYPFLRPDLFMGLREPARGMLLFGPRAPAKRCSRAPWRQRAAAPSSPLAPAA